LPETVKSIFALIVTVVALAGLAIFVVFLLGRVSATQADWDRYIYLLSGVEAVVFAAVGWLFGKEIHREQASKAESARDSAEGAKADAEARAAAEEAKGTALANAIIATSATQPQRQAALGRAGLADIDRAIEVTGLGVDELAAMARRIYPQLP